MLDPSLNPYGLNSFSLKTYSLLSFTNEPVIISLSNLGHFWCMYLLSVIVYQRNLWFVLPGGAPQHWAPAGGQPGAPMSAPDLKSKSSKSLKVSFIFTDWMTENIYVYVELECLTVVLLQNRDNYKYCDRCTFSSFN